MKKLFLLFALFIFLIIQDRVCFHLKSQFKKEAIFITFPYFQLVRLREKMAEIFIFGPYDKSNWQITLSRKRLACAEKALMTGCQVKEHNFLKDLQMHLEKASVFFQTAKDRGEDVNHLKKEIENVLLLRQNYLKNVSKTR